MFEISSSMCCFSPSQFVLQFSHISVFQSKEETAVVVMMTMTVSVTYVYILSRYKSVALKSPTMVILVIDDSCLVFLLQLTLMLSSSSVSSSAYC